MQREATEGRERTRASCSMICCTCLYVCACICVQVPVCIVRHRLRWDLAEPSVCQCMLLLACVRTSSGRLRVSREAVPRV